MPQESFRMKITLIRPPHAVSSLHKTLRWACPEIGIAYIASCARQAGHEVRVIDAIGEGLCRYSPFIGKCRLHGLPLEAIVERIEPDTKLVGVSVMFSDHWPVAKRLIAMIRERLPQAAIVCGGEHVSACPQLTFSDSPADYAVLGEGEETFVELTAHLSGEDGAKTLDQIPGLAFRNERGEVMLTSKRGRIRKLGELPWPAWDLFPVELYMTQNLFHDLATDRRTMVMLATRGCPYTCKFCSNDAMWGISYTLRDPKDVVDEMEYYVRTYGANDFHFQDPTLVINGKWCKKFAQEIIDRGLKVSSKLLSGTRCEALDAELLEKFGRAGIKELFLSPESGSKRILEINRKRVDLEKLIAVGRIIRDRCLPIETEAYLIIGFPEETLKDVLLTYLLLLRLAWNGFETAYINQFACYPGSEYHEIALKEGRIQYTDDYFLNLERNSNASASWHPRWGASFIRLLVALGHAIFFGSYYLAKPFRILQSALAILKREPQTRFEKHVAFRLGLWRPVKNVSVMAEAESGSKV